MRELYEKMRELKRKLESQEEKRMKMRREWEEKEREWEKREREWIREDAKTKEKMEERIKKLEEKVEEMREERERARKQNQETVSRNDKREPKKWEEEWSSWSEWSMDSEEGGEEEEDPPRRKMMKSEVRTLAQGRQGREGKEEIIRKYKSKVLVFKRGPNWREEIPIEDWIRKEVGVRVAVENIKYSRDSVKLWCDIEGVKGKIWEKKEEWKRRGMGKLEEWMTLEERLRRYKEMESLGAGVREGPRDVRERIEKRKREKRTWEEGRDNGQGWRLEEWRGEKAREKRKARCNKLD